MPLMMDIDPAAVDRLRSVGGAALVEQIVRLFLENTPKRLATIRKGIEGEEWYTAERAAHSMKSTAGNLGIAQMQDLAGQLECSCECHRAEEASGLLAQIESGWNVLRPRVEQLLRQPE
jgi:HPt (histidine-containing phosphotransfer) domain-containing protein